MSARWNQPCPRPVEPVATLDRLWLSTSEHHDVWRHSPDDRLIGSTQSWTHGPCEKRLPSTALSVSAPPCFLQTCILGQGTHDEKCASMGFESMRIPLLRSLRGSVIGSSERCRSKSRSRARLSFEPSLINVPSSAPSRVFDRSARQGYG